MHYLDNAATTRVYPAVADAADRALRTLFANPSSLYAPGADSEAAIEKARAQVAQSLGCTAGEIFFTASGTEGNNLAVLGACRAREKWARQVVVTGYEHASVQNACASLAAAGWQVIVVAPDAQGHVSLAALADAVTDKTALVTAMHVNNETGACLEVEKLAAQVKAKNSRTAVHVDGVQAWGKLSLALSKTQIDSYSVSGHKIHAPKGVGALYLRKGYHLAPTLFGGHQERGFRPGTENIAYIAALGEAAALLHAQAFDPAPLRARLLAGLAQMQEVVCNSPGDAYPGIVNFSVCGVKSQPLLNFLAEREIYVSSGSACDKGEPSHTLTAMGLSRERVDCALRVSFAAENTPDDVEALLAGVRAGAAALARMRR